VKKLAIVGLARGKELAPKIGKHWDVWRCNPGFWTGEDEIESFVGTTLWFEIHTGRYLDGAHGTKYRKLVEKLFAVTKTPIYFLKASEWKVKAKREFPRNKIAVGLPRGDYHAGSFDWMLAFAILEGYKHIELYGVDLGPTDTGEPISARPCLEYWCGVAAGKGVLVVSHSPSLFKIFNYQRASTPYHYDDTWRLVEDRAKQ
jgi:hypothetical protein